MATTPYVPPLAGTLTVSSGYGPRDGTTHEGIDYAAPAGTTVRAALSGTVVTASYSSGGWGNEVLLDNGIVNGQHVYTRYAHLLSLPSVTVGQKVTAGATLGKVGSTGDSTGNHLHFGTYVGGTTNSSAVNPASILSGLLNPSTGLGAAEAGLGALAPDVTAGIEALLAKIGAAADAFSSKAKVAEQIATSVTKLFLPNNLLRAAAGGLGVILLCFSLVFLGKELRT